MDVIVERAGCPDRAVTADPEGTVGALLRGIDDALGFARDEQGGVIHDYVYIRGDTGEEVALGTGAAAADVALTDLGLLGVGERIVVRARGVDVARERLRAAGVDLESTPALLAALTAGLAENAGAAARDQARWVIQLAPMLPGAWQVAVACAAELVERAVKVGRVDRIHDLASLGVSMDHPGDDFCNRSPAVHAVVEGQFEALRALVACGADPSGKPGNGGATRTLAQAVAHASCAKEMVTTLLDMGVRPLIEGDGFDRPDLTCAAQRGKADVVAVLLAHGAADADAAAPLLAARNADTAKVLLAHGAADGKDTCGRNALWHAACNSDAAHVKVLLDHGADPCASDATGVTPLFLAAGKDTVDMVAHLLAAGADVNAVDEDGDTALFAAICGGSTEVVEMLLAHGADVNIENEMGERALDKAADDERMLELLEKHGAIAGSGQGDCSEDSEA